MSADNAVSRAQARTNSMIDAAIQGGSVAEFNHKNMTVALRIGRRNVKLVGGDGVPTREGTRYYSQLGVPPPAVYPYEQGLINGKWIQGFDGKRHLVQRMTSDGKWATTKKGLDYFRYNRDEYEVKFTIRIAHPEKSDSKKSSLTKLFTEEDGEVWRIAKVDPNHDYSTGDIDDKAWKVGAIKGPAPNSRMSLLATDKEKEDHARKQGENGCNTAAR